MSRTRLCLQVVVVVAAIMCTTQVVDSNETMAAELFKQLIMNSDDRVRPNIYGKPVHVLCDFYVQSLGPLSEIEMEYDLEIYFHMRWTDSRMMFSNHSAPVFLPAKYLDKIWIPDLYFPNAKHAEFHDALLTNKHAKIYPNGTVLYSSRLTLRVSCPMSLTHFPLDYQECWLKASSYSYDTSDMILSWLDDDSIQVNEKIQLPQFFILEIKHHDDCTDTYKTGEFPCIVATFHFKRNVGYYVLQGYLPSILIVIIAWLSFWIHRDAVPARISLGVTTVLTMTTQLGSSRSSTVKVSYPKAMDVWYTFCMVLVFGALMEYAFVNVLSRRERTAAKREAERKAAETRNSSPEVTSNADKRQTRDDAVVDIEMEPINSSGCASRLGKGRNVNCQSKFMRMTGSVRNFPRVVKRRIQNQLSTAQAVDRFARVFYPAIFFVFNLLYWVIYTQRTILFSHDS